METYTSKFPPQNEIFKSIFIENHNYRGDMYKECNPKSRVEKCSFFNEISVEYRGSKHPQNYMERKNSRVRPIRLLNPFTLSLRDVFLRLTLSKALKFALINCLHNTIAAVSNPCFYVHKILIYKTR